MPEKRIFITYPPSTNRLWRTVKGRMIKSEAYRHWIAENMHLGYGLKCIDGHYGLTLHCTPPDKRARDLDNLIKPVSDLLQYIGAVTNDSNMQALSMFWTQSDKPGVEALVYPWP